MKRVIITGATGAIGTALIRKLVENQVEVLVLIHPDSKRKNHIPVHQHISVLECGMKDFSCMQNATGKKFDVFYHFAWAGAAGSGRHDMYLQNMNVKYALDAVALAHRFGCKLFIGSGSQAEYGRFEGLLQPNTPVFPEMGYGYAKLCAGQMTREYAHQLGMKHIWTRILSVYGPNDGSQSMVMSTICKLKNNEVPKFTKGEQMWDYLYSGDAAQAFYLLGNNGVDGKTYVLGSGQAHPLKEYIEMIRDIVNPNSRVDIGALPYGDKQVMHLQADITELQKDTGFIPCTNFKEGIKNVIKAVETDTI